MIYDTDYNKDNCTEINISIRIAQLNKGSSQKDNDHLKNVVV